MKKVPKGEFYFDSPKTITRLRTITLGHSTIVNLRTHLYQQGQRKVDFTEDWLEWDLMFTEGDGPPIRYRKLYSKFKDLLFETSLPDIRFHDLRHTAATQMLINGVDILTVSKRLSHSKSSVTLDIYGHMIHSVQEKVANIMDEIITPMTIER